jgi:hypothetical protein
LQKFRFIRLFIHSLFIITVFAKSSILIYGQADTIFVFQPDTISFSLTGDTIQKKRTPSENIIQFPISYTSEDSLKISMGIKRVFLFNESDVKYDEIELKSFHVELDIEKNEIFAFGALDSVGKPTGRPLFKDRDETFESDTLRYNFKSKKGRIIGVRTEQEGGYLHGRVTKKQANDHIHVRGGKYTTCDHEEPHFYIGMSRAIVIPGEKVISGPAHLVIEDIPLPLILPFGFFPNKRGKSSGVIFPSYGEEITRGFFLQELGYYFALSDYYDLKVTGDIYSLGSWRLSAGSNYNRRYRYSGSLALSFASNIIGEPGLINYEKRQDYSIRWQHAQDRKANPYSTFSGSVDFKSSRFNKLTSVNPDVFAQNTSNSSISFNKIWPGSPFTLNANARATQNFSTKKTQLNLPSVSFNMARQYPFRKDGSSGGDKWYDNVEFTYSANLDNRINTFDSLLFTKDAWLKSQHGFKHDLPIRSNFKLFNFLNITPGINYSGVLYTSRIEKKWDPDFVDPVTAQVKPSVITDTIYGLQYAHSINPNFSISMAPNIYGMFQFKNSKIEAIRHVMTPSVGFSFVPDMQGILPDYYREVQRDTTGNNFETYSIYANGIYGTPSLRGRSGNISIGLGNNFEMKIRTPEDTVSSTRKVKLLDRLNFSTNYNIFADSLNLSNISMSGSNSFFENKLNVSFSANFDPYALDENFRKYNSFEWSKNRRIARLTNANISFNTRLQSAGSKSKAPPPTPPPPGSGPEGVFDHMDGLPDPGIFLYDTYVDFDVPWSINLSYSLNYSKPGRESNVVQTLSFNGDLSLTPKWKITYSSGYDFQRNEFTMTSVSINRDLHCWEASATIVPFGTLKSYRFLIRVKSSILQDLKYQKQKAGMIIFTGNSDLLFNPVLNYFHTIKSHYRFRMKLHAPYI